MSETKFLFLLTLDELYSLYATSPDRAREVEGEELAIIEAVLEGRYETAKGYREDTIYIAHKDTPCQTCRDRGYVYKTTETEVGDFTLKNGEHRGLCPTCHGTKRVMPDLYGNELPDTLDGV